MLTRIRIQGFKSFDDVEVHLSPLTVLLGPNAAGKSNFLDALQLLSRLATSSSIEGLFQPPYRGVPLESFHFGSEGFSELLHQESASLLIEADFRLSSALLATVTQQLIANLLPDSFRPAIREEYLRYRVELHMRPQSGIVRVVGESLHALDEEGNPKDSSDAQLTERELKINGLAQRAGELESSILFLFDDIPLTPHLSALCRELSRWSFFYFEPRERMREANAVRETRHIGMMGENLASFLNTLKAVDPADFESLELSLETLVPSISGIEVGVDDRGEVELRLREDGKLMSSRVLSEGTLRLLGLLALGGAKERPTLIGFEEPENGVHPRRLRLLADLLKSYTESGDMQMIVTTHSPLLLDALPRESLYVCRKVNGRSRIAPLTKLDPLGRETDYSDWLDDSEDELAVSARVLRGDFDA